MLSVSPALTPFIVPGSKCNSNFDFSVSRLTIPLLWSILVTVPISLCSPLITASSIPKTTHGRFYFQSTDFSLIGKQQYRLLLMVGLARTEASSAALLLNLEYPTFPRAGAHRGSCFLPSGPDCARTAIFSDRGLNVGARMRQL